MEGRMEVEGVGNNSSSRGRGGFLVVDTKKRCFMCLGQQNKNNNKPADVSDCENENDNWQGGSVLPLSMLSRYLKISINEVVRKSVATSSSSVDHEHSEVPAAPPPPPQIENGHVGVRLCEGCSSRMDRFGKLYYQLQVIRMRVDGVVEEIEGVMTGAFMNEEEDEGERGGKSFEAHFAKNLRYEIMEKCFVNSGMTHPRVKLVDVMEEEEEAEMVTEEDANANTGQETGGCEDASKTFGDLLLEMEAEQLNRTNYTFCDEGIHLSGERVDVDIQDVQEGSSTNGLLPGPGGKGAPVMSSGNRRTTYAEVAKRGQCSRSSTTIVEGQGIEEIPEEDTDGDISSLFEEIFDDSEVDPAAVGGNLSSIGNDAAGNSSLVVTAEEFKRKVRNGVALEKKSFKSGLKTGAPAALPTKQPEEVTKRSTTIVNCDWCTETFGTRWQANLHTYAEHQEVIFSKFKNPQLSSQQFDSIVQQMFNDTILKHTRPIPNRKSTGKRTYVTMSCSFCDKIRKCNRRDAEAHMIRFHMEKVIPMLQNLQQQQLELDQGGGPRQGPAIPTGSTNIPSSKQSTKPKKLKRKVVVGRPVVMIQRIQPGGVKTAKVMMKGRTSKPLLLDRDRTKQGSKLGRPMLDTIKVASSRQVKFKRLPNGKFQCELCSRVMLKTNIKYHTSMHTRKSVP